MEWNDFEMMLNCMLCISRVELSHCYWKLASYKWFLKNVQMSCTFTFSLKGIKIIDRVVYEGTFLVELVSTYQTYFDPAISFRYFKLNSVSLHTVSHYRHESHLLYDSLNLVLWALWNFLWKGLCKKELIFTNYMTRGLSHSALYTVIIKPATAST
jgi:hypothetical protein